MADEHELQAKRENARMVENCLGTIQSKLKSTLRYGQELKGPVLHILAALDTVEAALGEWYKWRAGWHLCGPPILTQDPLDPARTAPTDTISHLCGFRTPLQEFTGRCGGCEAEFHGLFSLPSPPPAK